VNPRKDPRGSNGSGDLNLAGGRVQQGKLPASSPKSLCQQRILFNTTKKAELLLLVDETSNAPFASHHVVNPKSCERNKRLGLGDGGNPKLTFIARLQGSSRPS
jgi:hypothetical protein